MKKRKPRKRLVGLRQYAKTSMDQLLGYSGAIVVICIGTALLGLSLILIRDGSDGYGDLFALFGGGVFGICSLITLWYGTTLFNAAAQIRPVELISKHNAKYLPEVKTLVRGSDPPTVDQQAELLRVAGHGQQIPPEQLLRAVQGEEQDV